MPCLGPPAFDLRRGAKARGHSPRWRRTEKKHYLNVQNGRQKTENAPGTTKKQRSGEETGAVLHQKGQSANRQSTGFVPKGDESVQALPTTQRQTGHIGPQHGGHPEIAERKSQFAARDERKLAQTFDDAAECLVGIGAFAGHQRTNLRSAARGERHSPRSRHAQPQHRPPRIGVAGARKATHRLQTPLCARHYLSFSQPPHAKQTHVHLFLAQLQRDVPPHPLCARIHALSARTGPGHCGARSRNSRQT